MQRRPLSLSPGRSGFSLIEVVIAIGIISFALVGILGLFPVAMDAATKSQQETQAALIARTLYTDINATTGTKRFLITKAHAGGAVDKVDVDMTRAGDYYLSYDTEGVTGGTISAGEYTSGKPGAAYVARLKVLPLPATTPGLNLQDGLSQITVTVETPAAAQRAKRQSYLFASMMRQGIVAPTPTP